MEEYIQATALHLAVQKPNNTKKITYLLANGTQVNELDEVSYTHITQRNTQTYKQKKYIQTYIHAYKHTYIHTNCFLLIVTIVVFVL